MFNEIFQPNDIVEFRCIHPIRNGSNSPYQFWTRFSAAGKIKAELKNLNKLGYGIYYGLLPRAKEGSGGDNDILPGNILWADFDYSHKRKEKGVKINEIRAQIEDSQLPSPSIYVNSGHGIHAYWLLRKRHNPSILKDMNDKIRKQFRSDNVSNPSRIFRVPGFVNTKEPMADAKIIEETGERFDLNDFVFDYIEEKPKIEKKIYAPPTNSDTVSRAKAYIAKIQGSGEGGRHHAVYSVAAVLIVDFSLPTRDALSLLADWDSGHCNPPLQEIPGELDAILRCATKYAKGDKGSKLTNAQVKTYIVEQKTQPQGTAEYKKRLDAFASGAIRPIHFSGFGRIREISGLGMRGNYVVIAGSEGEGKSMLAINICIAAHRAHHKFSYLPLEDTRADWQARALAIVSGSWSPIGQEPEQAIEALRLLAENQSSIDGLSACVADNPMKVDVDNLDDDIPLISAQWVLKWIQAERKRSDLIVIDCLSRISFPDRQQYRGESDFVHRLEALAQDKVIILICHTRRKNFTERSKSPHADDVQGAKTITRNAHVGLLLETHEPKDSAILRYGSATENCEHERSIHIVKARNASGKGRMVAITMQEGGLFREIGVIARNH